MPLPAPPQWPFSSPRLFDPLPPPRPFLFVSRRPPPARYELALQQRAGILAEEARARHEAAGATGVEAFERVGAGEGGCRRLHMNKCRW